MAESFSRWEADPLFSAAEVVQDSADRMDSAYRLLMHEEKLVQTENSDKKLLSSINYHKRDLATALETTRWQLEDFERAVDLAALSDKSNSRKNTISKFNQFIQAIRQQIVQVEKGVDNNSLVTKPSKSSQFLNPNEQDSDNLASFLSGSVSDQAPFVGDNNRSNIMKRFLDSSANCDEIVELNDEVVIDIEECAEEGPANLESDNLGVKFVGYSYKNGITRSNWGFLRNFWVNRNKESLTKRRKDGEILDDETRFSNSNLPLADRDSCFWGSNLTENVRFVRSFNQHQFRLATIVLISLVFLCLLVLRIA